LLFGAGALALAASIVLYARGLGKESTDDAQVEGHVIPISARIVGQVAQVSVRDNALVDAGQLLAKIDPADYVAKVEAARADVDSAQAALENARATLALTERNASAILTQALGGITEASSMQSSNRAISDQAVAEIAGATARKRLAEANLLRARNLLSDGSGTQADLDGRQAEYDLAVSALAQATARHESARASATASAGSVVLARGRLAAAETGPQQVQSAKAALLLAEARARQAEAALKIAELNLSYTEIAAPRRGIVSRRTVEEGQWVSPERPMLAIVPIDDVWIVANFKEDQLARIRPGQPSTIQLDTYGRRKFSGHVESIASGTGARFALLPPDNASGNFVKVTQRIPVLIRLDGDVDVAARPGMSAEVTVRVSEN
jgi:membrane fusion protein (multidrug efflux system)